MCRKSRTRSGSFRRRNSDTVPLRTQMIFSNNCLKIIFKTLHLIRIEAFRSFLHNLFAACGRVKTSKRSANCAKRTLRRQTSGRQTTNNRIPALHAWEQSWRAAPSGIKPPLLSNTCSSMRGPAIDCGTHGRCARYPPVHVITDN